MSADYIYGLNPKEWGNAYIASRVLDGELRTVKDTPSMLGVGYDGHVVIKKVPEYVAGDDISFTDPVTKTRILHRITAVKPGFVYTKGTFNKNGDGWVAVENINGKVVWPRPKM